MERNSALCISGGKSAHLHEAHIEGNDAVYGGQRDAFIVPVNHAALFFAHGHGREAVDVVRKTAGIPGVGGSQHQIRRDHGARIFHMHCLLKTFPRRIAEGARRGWITAERHIQGDFVIMNDGPETFHDSACGFS